MAYGKGLAGGLIALALLAACSDGTGPGEGELSQVEAGVLLTRIDQWISAANDNVVWDAKGSFAVDVPCQVKGKVAVSATFTGDTLTTSGGFEKDSVFMQTVFALDYQNCREASPDGPWTLDGTLTDTRAERYNVPNDVDDYHRETKGTVDWRFDGRSGACTVDLVLDTHSDPGSSTRTATGTVCGFDLAKITGG